MMVLSYRVFQSSETSLSNLSLLDSCNFRGFCDCQFTLMISRVFILSFLTELTREFIMAGSDKEESERN